MIKDSKHVSIAITGSAGFIGSSFIKFLNTKGITNITIYEKLDEIGNKWKNIAGLNFTSIEPHTSLKENLNNHDWIVLLGANSATTTKDGEHKQVLDDNYYYIRDILREVRQLFNKKVIFASSAATYGYSTDFKERIFDIEPVTFYGLSKLLVDRELEKYYNFGQNSYYSFRYYNCFGAREAHKASKNMTSPIYRFLTGSPPYVLYKKEGTEFKRDFIWINDLCETMFYALTNECESGLYNLGSAEATTWKELLQIICEIKGEEFDKVVKYEPLPDHLAQQYQEITQSDNTRLHNVLGYKEDFTPLRTAIKKTWDEITKKAT